jgi:hypothetical protein
MIIVATIATVPPVQFYRRTAAVPFLTGFPMARLLGVDPLRRPLGGSIGGCENSNGGLSLDNADGVLARRWAVPPLGAAVTVESLTTDGQRTTLFTGKVAKITMGSTVKVELEA